MIEQKVDLVIAKERVDELMPLLRTLTKEEKKSLTVHLKKLSKHYKEFGQNGSSWSQKGSPTQINMVNVIGFVCLNRKEYQKLDDFAGILTNKDIDSLLNWYCPDWFSDYINDLTKRDWMPWHFQYNMAVDLEEKKYVVLSDELVARLMPQMIFERNEKNIKYLYAPQNLEKRKITLEKHIWLIFQYEVPMHLSDRYHQFENISSKDESLWIKTIRDLSNRGLLERNRLLKESLLATGRNFNREVSGWFVTLFEALDPATEELLAMQSELLSTLASQHSRAVNAVLTVIKSVSDEKEFNVRGFLDHAPVLLTSETKSIVSATVYLFDKFARQHPSLREELCVTACQAFIHADEQIQSRVCKLLLKYTDSNSSEQISDELAKYSESLLMSSKKVLADFTSKVDESMATSLDSPVDTHASPIDDAPRPLQVPSSLDELIFLASQAFDNNDPLHIELLPAALINMQDQLTGPMLHKLEAALQRAYTLIAGDWRSHLGYLDHLLATFFIDFTTTLVERFPVEGASLKQIHENFKIKHATQTPELFTWAVHSWDNTYLIHKTFLYMVYVRLKDGIQLPLLSTPTHEPAYIDPMILVKRLAEYQAKNATPDEYDFQLGISRLAPFNHSDALSEARQRLQAEALRVMEFLLVDEARPMRPFTSEPVWFMAGVMKSPHAIYSEFDSLYYQSLSKSIFTGDVSWKSYVENYSATQYNFQKKRNEEVALQRQVLRLSLPEPPTIWQKVEKPKGLLTKMADWLAKEKIQSRTQPYILYEFLSLKPQWLSSEPNDIQRFINLFPSNPNPLLALVASRCLERSTFSSELDKRMVTRTLESLITLKFCWSEITHVFVASCMLTSDKTVRSFAAELWISAVKSEDVKSDQLGRIIGSHFSGEYAPVKRFTDLISESLLKISSQHNRSLEAILTATIDSLRSEPPVGTKRLLELYSEILLMNGSTVPVNAEQKLSQWNSISGLKKVLASLKSGL